MNKNYLNDKECEELKKRIDSSVGRKAFAKLLGIGYSALANKLNGFSNLSREEAKAYEDVLKKNRKNQT